MRFPFARALGRDFDVRVVRANVARIESAHWFVEFQIDGSKRGAQRRRPHRLVVGLRSGRGRPQEVVPLSVDAVIDVGSVNTSERDRDSDLRSSDWFNVERYPTMHFVSSHVDPLPKPNQFRVTGTLSLHGVNRDVTLDVTASSAKRDGHGVVHRAYTATANFDRRDFGLDAYTSGGGTLLVGTGVAVTINLEMIEAE